MTTTALDRISTPTPPAAAMADRIGQATAVEQARAVAEVQAAIIVAQQCPRDLQASRRQMLDSCAQPALAERSSFRFSRAGSQVSGPSIHLARELARCFGNVQYGISELRRDDEHGQSEMQAWAWDVENNTRTAHTFIVPHRRDTRSGQKVLTDLRDIYENNANNGARRVREAIFAVLPPWFVEEAKAACAATLEHGGGKPLQERIATAIELFALMGISEAQLEDKVGRPVARWTPQDVAMIGVVYNSVRAGEVTLDDEFPPARVTRDEIAAPPTDAEVVTEGGES